jgi:hypothetical protein
MDESSVGEGVTGSQLSSVTTSSVGLSGSVGSGATGSGIAASISEAVEITGGSVSSAKTKVGKVSNAIPSTPDIKTLLIIV